MTFASRQQTRRRTCIILLWTLDFYRPSYVHQLDFEGAGRQGRKQGVVEVEVEFDT